MSHSDSDYDMSDGDDEEDSIVEIVPEHLGNQDTLAKLAFIDDLKKFAINELVNLPQVRLSLAPFFIVAYSGLIQRSSLLLVIKALAKVLFFKLLLDSVSPSMMLSAPDFLPRFLSNEHQIILSN